MKDPRTAVVLLSGGQDSVTILHHAAWEHGPENVHALSFSYGQRHSVELDAARDIAERLNIASHHIVDGKALTLWAASSKLLKSVEAEPVATFGPSTGPITDVPASFVPMRNAFFLTVAWGFALENDARVIYAGMCETDYSGYPDCRLDFVNKIEAALRSGYPTEDMPVTIVTPLMHLTKAETFMMAYEMGEAAYHDVLMRSRTCYNGSEMMNDWGYGCGICPACELRRDGFYAFQQQRAQG